MNYLNRENAQQIADRIMEIVPHNINIMDSHGIIIASGDKRRIGTKHQGALQVLERRGAYCVYADTVTERKGINLPIFCNGKLEGVIGISGEVDEIMQLGRLVVTTAQLMIENNISNEENVNREIRLNNFFFEWTHRQPKDYSGSFQEQAAYFRVNLDAPRAAALITMQQTHYTLVDPIRSLLGPEDYLVAQSLNSLVILFEAAKPFDAKLARVMAVSDKLQYAYVSNVCPDAFSAVVSANNLASIAQRLQVPWRIVYERQLLLESKFCLLPVDPVEQSIMEALTKGDSGDSLRLTILNYVECGDDLKKVCEKLYIHRNTLNYRIDKIREKTGLNLKNGKDMMLLYMAALQLSMNQHLN